MVNQSHYHFNETMVLDYETTAGWIQAIFQAGGLSQEDAALVADSLVDADARGVYSHGIQRTRMYMRRIDSDCINLHGQPRILVEDQATAVVEGDNAMGQVVGRFAMNLAIEKARQYGVSFVAARGSNHYGRCAYYARMALEQNMLGFSTTIGGGNLMAPWGGTDKRVGNNPFCVAIPAGEAYPVVLDMAQSVVAKGKLDVALKTNTTIPDSWAFDASGLPTTDPAEGMKGSLRPIADYKGSGLSIVVGLLSSVISNAAIGSTLKTVYADFSGGLNKGQLFAAVDLARMTDIDAFKARMDREIRFIKASPAAVGVDEVLLPGEMEYQAYEKQTREGITYPIEVLREVKAVADRLGVASIAGI